MIAVSSFAGDFSIVAIQLQDKFSDVVNWLKANSSNGENKSALGSQAASKSLESETKENDGRLSFLKPAVPVANSSPGFGAVANSSPSFGSLANSSSSFGASWSSGGLFNNKSPFSFGKSSLSWMLYVTSFSLFFLLLNNSGFFTLLPF